MIASIPAAVRQAAPVLESEYDYVSGTILLRFIRSARRRPSDRITAPIETLDA
jgi:hypothetical protein